MRSHSFTIVDTPGGGTLLTLDDVFDVLVHEDWQSLGDQYDREVYQNWLSRDA